MLPAAAAAYQRALRSDPDFAEAHDRLGFVLGQPGPDRGRDRRTSAARSSCGPEAVRRAIPPGRDAVVDARLRGSARPALEAAVRLRPAHAEARYYLGLALRQHGELGRRRSRLRRPWPRLRPGSRPLRSSASRSSDRRPRGRDRRAAARRRARPARSSTRGTRLGLALTADRERPRRRSRAARAGRAARPTTTSRGRTWAAR